MFAVSQTACGIKSLLQRMYIYQYDSWVPQSGVGKKVSVLSNMLKIFGVSLKSRNTISIAIIFCDKKVENVFQHCLGSINFGFIRLKGFGKAE
jgi:hypothetical protein